MVSRCYLPRPFCGKRPVPGIRFVLQVGGPKEMAETNGKSKNTIWNSPKMFETHDS